jgi:hypothetical protein
MWRKEGWTQEKPVTVSSFAEMAMDFCSRNSFDRPPQAPRSAVTASTNGSARAVPHKRPMNEMSEDEQLEAAMRASIQDAMGDDAEAAVSGGGDNVDDLDVEDSKPAAKEDAKLPSMHDELVAMIVADEPASGARIQYRLPDGKKLVRKFEESDSIKNVYASFAVRVTETETLMIYMLMLNMASHLLSISPFLTTHTAIKRRRAQWT